MVHTCNRSKNKNNRRDLIEQEEAKVEQVVLVILAHLNIARSSKLLLMKAYLRKDLLYFACIIRFKFFLLCTFIQ